MSNPPLLWDVESDPVLAGTKMIAEAWDAAGLYQVGSFVGDGWKEWNDQFRDDVRDFFRGANDSVRRMADRLIGSPGIYGQKGREAVRVSTSLPVTMGLRSTTSSPITTSTTAKMARTAAMDVTTTEARTAASKAPPTIQPIESLRNRQAKNFLTASMLTVGVPMFVMGDEMRRSQHGNNNAYCQDNETSWFDWDHLSKQGDMLRF